MNAVAIVFVVSILSEMSNQICSKYCTIMSRNKVAKSLPESVFFVVAASILRGRSNDRIHGFIVNVNLDGP